MTDEEILREDREKAKELEERYKDYAPTDEELRLLELINDPRNVVTVNEEGERDLSFMKQELSKPENAIWCTQEAWNSAIRLSHSKRITPQQFGNFLAAEHQLWHETKFGKKCSFIR